MNKWNMIDSMHRTSHDPTMLCRLFCKRMQRRACKPKSIRNWPECVGFNIFFSFHQFSCFFRSNFGIFRQFRNAEMFTTLNTSVNELTTFILIQMGWFNYVYVHKMPRLKRLIYLLWSHSSIPVKMKLCFLDKAMEIKTGTEAIATIYNNHLN